MSNPKHYTFDNIFNGVGRAVDVFDEALEVLGLDAKIDEIAYLLPNRHLFNAFTKEAVQEDGCTMFNAADDHVHTLPLRTCYDVEYRFFTVPQRFLDFGHVPVRIEAMQWTEGLSPLHQAGLVEIAAIDAKALAVHASFKVETEEAYAAVVHRLRERGWEAAQRCESTYGRFSYWTPLERSEWLPDGPFMYLKPRVNLRDGLAL